MYRLIDYGSESGLVCSIRPREPSLQPLTEGRRARGLDNPLVTN